MGAEAVAGALYPRPLRQSRCTPPFLPLTLVCTACPLEHDLALVFVRADRPEIPPWALFYSDVMGAA
jgi:hypothetical protein